MACRSTVRGRGDASFSPDAARPRGHSARADRAIEFVAALAAPLLILEAIFVPGRGSAFAQAATLSARLSSATRVARERTGSGYWLVTTAGAVTAFGERTRLRIDDRPTTDGTDHRHRRDG